MPRKNARPAAKKERARLKRKMDRPKPKEPRRGVQLSSGVPVMAMAAVMMGASALRALRALQDGGDDE